jgi:hypothetical protein
MKHTFNISILVLLITSRSKDVPLIGINFSYDELNYDIAIKGFAGNEKERC